MFESHFEHCAESYGRSDDIQLDSLYDCLEGDALSYFCSLAPQSKNTYQAAKKSLTQGFGDLAWWERLTTHQQGNYTLEVYTQKIRTIVPLASLATRPSAQVAT